MDTNFWIIMILQNVIESKIVENDFDLKPLNELNINNIFFSLDIKPKALKSVIVYRYIKKIPPIKNKFNTFRLKHD